MTSSDFPINEEQNKENLEILIEPSAPQIFSFPTRQNTLIVCDWDDTLFPSTAIVKMGYTILTEDSLISQHFKYQLFNLRLQVYKFLRTLTETAPLCIVTNGEEGWVQQSSEKFLPLLAEFPQVKILSARSQFESQFPDQHTAWKYESIRSCINPDIKYIISLGDSTVERDAVLALARNYGLIYKSLKFIDHPTISQLFDEIGAVTTEFPNIFSCEFCIDNQLNVSYPCIFPPRKQNILSPIPENICEDFEDEFDRLKKVLELYNENIITLIDKIKILDGEV